jgi:1-acyl-sn-glycerol-3-phosphate acyltransferase
MKNVIHEYDNGFRPKNVKIKDNYNFYPSSLMYNILNFIVLLLTKVLIIIPKLLMGFKVTGKENLKDINNAVFISNHVHFMDAFLIGTSIFPKKLYCTTIKSNLGFSIISKYFRLCGAVPIPNILNQKKRFLIQSINTLKSSASPSST